MEVGVRPADEAKGGPAGSRRALVLVADDDDIVLSSLSQNLGTAYDVLTAPDGETALELALLHNPDLVLADVFMPRIDGFGLVQALRSQPQTKTIPVILLTGRIDEKLRVQGLKRGADDYLVKPFNQQELMVRIEARLELSRARREAELRERQLRYEAEDAQQNLRFLADTAVILSSSLDLKATLAQVVELSVPRIGDWCAVNVHAEDGSLQCVAVKHTDPVKMEALRELTLRFPPKISDSSGVGKVMRTGLSELREEISGQDLAELTRGGEHTAAVSELGIRSTIIVPMFARDRILGTIGFACAGSGRRFGKRDLALAEAVAQRVALAIENANLYLEVRRANEELEARVEKRTRELALANSELTAEIQERIRRGAELAVRTRQQSALTQLGQLALANGSASALLDEAVSQVARTLEVEMCKVLQLSPVNGCATLVAGVGWNEGRLGQATDRIDSDTPAGFTLKDAMPVVVDDFSIERRFHGSRLLREHGAVSGIIVAIGGPTNPWGVLGAYSSKRRQFTPDDVNFVQSVAHLLGVIIGRREVEHSLLKLSLRLMTAEDAERRRIAKELHDSTAQDLVAVIMNLELLNETAAGRDPLVAKQIEDSRALLENCAHENPDVVLRAASSKARRSRIGGSHPPLRRGLWGEDGPGDQRRSLAGPRPA